MNFTFRPIGGDWPATANTAASGNPFSASYSATLNLLDRELHQLGARNIVVQLDLEERDIRLDGLPRASARPATERVILSFESIHGPLRYATGAYRPWQANVRAIALGLEALRKVDRYGITRRGEQYTGWKALPQTAGMTPAAALSVLAPYGGDVRRALMETHPDHGGDPDEFQRVLEAKEAISGVSA